MIPEWSAKAGFQVKRVEQGKGKSDATGVSFHATCHLHFARLNGLSNIIGVADPQNRPLKLSASVCYDATDLALASDLKSRNDVYIVCALNQDVGTFDRMSEGLHYHMYQGVIVVNNGQFGGAAFTCLSATCIIGKFFISMDNRRPPLHSRKSRRIN